MNLREQFYSRGYTDPKSVGDKSAIVSLRENLENCLNRKDLDRLEERNERHLDNNLIQSICLDCEVVNSVKNILGKEILLYSSTIFIKYPGDPAFPWHQDGDFLHLNPVECVTVWLAIDSCFNKNGALKFLDFSHENRIPHLNRSNQRSSFQAHADPKKFNDSSPKIIELKTGDFVAFHPYLMHSSGTNLSLERRAAISIRFTIPSVDINHNAFFGGHYTVVIP